MSALDPHEHLVELLIDGARYGDLEDVESALTQHHVAVDSKDEAGRTGKANWAGPHWTVLVVH